MEILFKDKYKITVNKYSWDLHMLVERQKDTKAGPKGSTYWTDEGFFTSLNSLFEKIVRLEHDADQNTYDITEFLSMWYAIVKKFKEEVEVV